MKRKARIVHVAIAVSDDGDPGAIEDAINETLRPARLDPLSGILDYAFNSDDNFRAMPSPVDFEYAEPYEEDEFLDHLPRVGVALRKLHSFLNYGGDISGADFIDYATVVLQGVGFEFTYPAERDDDDDDDDTDPGVQHDQSEERREEQTARDIDAEVAEVEAVQRDLQREVPVYVDEHHIVVGSDKPFGTREFWDEIADLSRTE